MVLYNTTNLNEFIYGVVVFYYKKRLSLSTDNLYKQSAVV